MAFIDYSADMLWFTQPVLCVWVSGGQGILAYCKERVLKSETATRVMSLKLSEPMFPHPSEGDKFMPSHSHYREAIWDSRRWYVGVYMSVMMGRILSLLTIMAHLCLLCLRYIIHLILTITKWDTVYYCFSHFPDKRSWGNLHQVSSAGDLRFKSVIYRLRTCDVYLPCHLASQLWCSLAILLYPWIFVGNKIE